MEIFVSNYYELDIDFCRKFTSFSEIPDYNDIVYLICSENNLQLEDIPKLPNNLIHFLCDYNNLTHLPELPDTIRVVECKNNRLEILTKLPKQLKSLNCWNNRLKTLPRLPELLEQLICRNNQLIYLPELPKSLTSLECRNNNLAYLPKLPRTLKYLDCRNNNLTYLPELPIPLNSKSLTYLFCCGNQFITKQEDYLQKIIYCLTPNKKRFIENLFGEFGEKCLECEKEFINCEKYKFKKWHGENITIKNEYCNQCLEFLE